MQIKTDYDKLADEHVKKTMENDLNKENKEEHRWKNLPILREVLFFCETQERTTQEKRKFVEVTTVKTKKVKIQKISIQEMQQKMIKDVSDVKIAPPEKFTENIVERTITYETYNIEEKE